MRALNYRNSIFLNNAPIKYLINTIVRNSSELHSKERSDIGQTGVQTIVSKEMKRFINQ